MSEAKTLTQPYFGNEMQAFNDGVQTSLQFRLAFDFIKVMAATYHEPFEEGTPGGQAAACVRYAYDLAECLLAQGVRLGYVRQISDSHECNAATRKMIDRQTDAGLHQAKANQQAQRNALAGSVAIPMPGQGVQ